MKTTKCIYCGDKNASDKLAVKTDDHVFRIDVESRGEQDNNLCHSCIAKIILSRSLDVNSVGVSEVYMMLENYIDDDYEIPVSVLERTERINKQISDRLKDTIKFINTKLDENEKNLFTSINK